MSFAQSHKQWQGSRKSWSFGVGGENTAICICKRLWGMAGTARILQDVVCNWIGVDSSPWRWCENCVAYPEMVFCHGCNWKSAGWKVFFTAMCMWAQQDWTSCRAGQMYFTIGLPFAPPHSCSAPPPSATKESLSHLWQQQAALLHCLFSRSLGHLEISRHCYKAMS